MNIAAAEVNTRMVQKKTATNNSTAISAEVYLKSYQLMYRSRVLDNKSITLYKQNKCHFQIGVAGHECIQVALGQHFEAGKDWFYPYYREMALCATLGMTDEEFMMMCMNKKGDPNSHGRMMPMHYGHKKLNIPQQSSPTGTQFLQAVGVALGARHLKSNEIVYVSSGEGTCSQGDFHEALSWASREKLPVLFCIQNNNYAISVHVSEQLGAKSVYDLTAGYENLTRYSVDGTDFDQCYNLGKKVVADLRAGKGPVLIEAHVARLQSHSISDDQKKYIEKDVLAEIGKQCPVAKLRKFLIKEKIVSEKELDGIEEKIRIAVDTAADTAEASPDCSAEEAETFNYVNPDPSTLFTENEPTGEETYLVDALNHALDEELSRNKNMLVFGQDVAHGKGGVFTVTSGLTKKHGKNRVFNAPLAESSIAGVAAGLSTRGLKPVAEIQFGDYVWTAMMQIRNELAMMYYRSGGDFTTPAVIRIPVGGYIHGGAYHSQNIEATFSHFPGLFIVYPSNATDAKGLLKASIRGNDPVLFLEHKGLYRQVYAKGKEGGIDDCIPLGKAKIVREGSDLTIVTYGAIVQKSILAAQALAEEGVSVEVIDLRTIVPLDFATIKSSLEKTGRVLIAHEDVTFMGFGAEVAAKISEECFTLLDAPVKRLGMKYAAAVSHSPVMESATLPQNDDVLRAAREVLAF
jgi:2-oxoisovalerate dehydrogenase E1 component